MTLYTNFLLKNSEEKAKKWGVLLDRVLNQWRVSGLKAKFQMYWLIKVQSPTRSSIIGGDGAISFSALFVDLDHPSTNFRIYTHIFKWSLNSSNFILFFYLF